MSLGVVMEMPRLMNIPLRSKVVYIHLVLIPNGLDRQINWTILTLLRWSSLLLLEYCRWLLVIFILFSAIALKMVNNLHFKSYIDFFCEWLPQQIFFFSTFGYMCVLIIYKWTIAWDFERDTSQAPSIIGQMIALPLNMGSTEGKPLWDQQ